MIESFIKKVSVKSRIYSGKAEDTVVSVRVCDVRKRGKTVLSITPNSENYCVNNLPISGLLQCEQGDVFGAYLLSVPGCLRHGTGESFLS